MSPTDPPDRENGSGSSFFRDVFQSRYREVTVSAVVFALIIGLVMNAAITYAGLKIGFTIGGSAIAAVLGFGVLRGLMGKGTILETNIAQTCASAINTSNSGIIFTVPVLLLLGIQLSWGDLDFWLIALAGIAGAMLGTAFIIPLRKQMIDIDRLRFPTGTGVAVILKSPGAGPKKAVVLVAGIVLAALIYLPVALPGIQPPANVKNLDKLVASERIKQVDAERTRAIHKWIEQKAAPADVLARGAIVAELQAAKKQLAASTERATRKQIKTRITEIETRLAQTPVAGPYGDSLCLAAHEANSGAKPWSSLRSTSLGWAKDPLPGYADLGIRLSPVKDASGRLSSYVDHDGNGQPDLLVTDDHIDFGRMFGLPGQFELILAIAPFALGAGFITGFAGLFVLAGGILAYFFLAPLGMSLGWFPANLEPFQAPGYAFGAFNRPLGIGLLLGGAMMGVVSSFPAIKAALKSVASAGKLKGGSDELSIKVVAGAAIAAVFLLYLAADFVGNKPLNQNCPITHDEVSADVDTVEYQGYAIAFADQESRAAWVEGKTFTDAQKQAFLAEYNAKPGWLAGLNPHLRALLIAIIGALWIWFAGIIIAQCTGMTDWSPISGMALLTVVLVMLLAGTGAVVGAVLIGAALCVAITLAADMMQDLRTGHLVGAQPRRQQVMELLVVGVGPAVSMIVVLIIAQANLKSFGVALGPGTPTSAPQAQALQAVINGVQGGEMPYALYGFGAILGALLGLGAFSGLGVLVGLSMYLPFQYIATYGVGCVVQMIVARIKGRRWAEEWGVPFAAGLIVGESILALIINLIVLGTG